MFARSMRQARSKETQLDDWLIDHAQDGSPEPYVCPESERHLYEDAVVPEPVNADPAFFDTLPMFIRESESRRRWKERFAGNSPKGFVSGCHLRHVRTC